jgi:hypothetical protein
MMEEGQKKGVKNGRRGREEGKIGWKRVSNKIRHITQNLRIL